MGGQPSEEDSRGQAVAAALPGAVAGRGPASRRPAAVTIQ
jgi:hypothetical protein